MQSRLETRVENLNIMKHLSKSLKHFMNTPWRDVAPVGIVRRHLTSAFVRYYSCHVSDTDLWAMASCCVRNEVTRPILHIIAGYQVTDGGHVYTSITDTMLTTLHYPEILCRSHKSSHLLVVKLFIKGGGLRISKSHILFT